MIKKVIVFIVSLSLIVLPIIEAQAALPALAGVFTYTPAANAAAYGANGAALAAANDGVAIVGASAGSAAVPLAVGAGALAVGAAVGYYGVGYICSLLCPDSNPNPVIRIAPSKDAAKQAPLPTGLPTIPASPADMPSGLSQTAQIAQNCYAVGDINNPAPAAGPSCGTPNTIPLCLQFASAAPTRFCLVNNNGVNYAITNMPNDVAVPIAGQFGANNQKVSAIPHCPSGYTTGSTTCSPSNPRAIQKDGAIDVVPSSSTGFTIPLDADNVSSDYKPVLSPDTKAVTVHGLVTDNNGKKHEAYVTTYMTSYANDQYRTKVSYNPSEYGVIENQPVWQQQTVDTQAGLVTNVSASQVYGQPAAVGSTVQNSAGSTSTVSAGEPVFVQPSVNAATAPTTVTSSPVIPQTSSTPNQQITFPTDYARTGEAASAANTITANANTNANKIVDKLAETEPDTDLQANQISNPLPSYFTGLTSWAAPNVSGQCPTASFNVFSHDYNFNVMCDLFNDNLPIIQGAMNVLYVLAALFIVLGA